MANRIGSKDWKKVNKLAADGTIQWVTFSDGDARVCHRPGGRMRCEALLAESPIDGALWRRLRNPNGSWTNAHPISGTIETEAVIR